LVELVALNMMHANVFKEHYIIVFQIETFSSAMNTWLGEKCTYTDEKGESST
jgi:hypothetical protein